MKQTIINQGEQQFERLLKLYLTRRNASPNQNFAEHLDEDTLTAFAEGSLNKRFDLPIISHLTDCSTCRRSTLELVRLDEQFSEDAIAVAASPAAANSFQNFWSELKSKVFNSADNTVFAHQESDEEDQAEKTNDGNETK